MEYKHFSHQHPLTLYKVQPEDQNFKCHGCNSQCRDSILACWSCNFFLHEHCGNANRYVKHPSHSLHPLVLLPTPTYCSGLFYCDCCGEQGSKFSYCCPLCEVDLHMDCAYLPPKVKHDSHQHDVYLSFGQIEKRDLSEICNICTKELTSRHWSYFCEKPECDYRIHTFCATSEVKPGLYQDDEPEEVVQVSEGSTVQDIGLSERFQLQMQIQMAQQMNSFFQSSGTGVKY